MAEPRSLSTVKKMLIAEAARVGINASAAVAGLSGKSIQFYRIRLAGLTGETLIEVCWKGRLKSMIFRDDPRLLDGRLTPFHPQDDVLIGDRFGPVATITRVTATNPSGAPLVVQRREDRDPNFTTTGAGSTPGPQKTSDPAPVAGGEQVGGLASTLASGVEAVGTFIGDIAPSLIEAGVAVGTQVLTQKAIGSGSSAPGTLQVTSDPFAAGSRLGPSFERDAAGNIVGFEGIEFGESADVGAALSKAFFPTISKYTGSIVGARASNHVMVNPVTGKPTWFKPAGEVALWTSDFAAARKVKRLARKAARKR